MCNILQGMAGRTARVWGMGCSAGWEPKEDDRGTTWCHLIHSTFYVAKWNKQFPVLDLS